MIKCRSVRVRADRDEDGKPVVSLTLGNVQTNVEGLPGRIRIEEAGRLDMPPMMARKIVDDLLEAAAEVEKLKKKEKAA